MAIRTTYRAMEVTRPGVLQLVERETRDPGAGEVLIQVEACGICGADASTIEGLQPGLQYPRVPGQEVVGRIAALGMTTVTDSAAASALIPALAPQGTLLVLGAGKDPLSIPPRYMVSGERMVQGSITGSPFESEKTLAFSVLANVRPSIETMPLERAQEAYQRMRSGQAKFRMVLTMGNARSD